MSIPSWFITGASNGLGLILALRALEAKHRVIGAVRNKTKSADAVKQIEDAGGQVIEMDMTESKESITKKVQSVGQIDYLINNAGYSIIKACESISEQEAEVQMRTNFLGPLYATQAALAGGMRARGSGTVVSVSSIAARDPLPGCTLYSASKGALEALSAALAREVAPFGVRVLVVEPGAFRTNFIPGMRAMSAAGEAMPAAYRGTPADDVLRRLAASHGAQRGDPARAVERIFEAVTGTGLAGPLRGSVDLLVLGPDALARLRSANEKFLQDLSLQEHVATSTDF